jgi:hypothetical protein
MIDLHPYICPQCQKSHGLTGNIGIKESKYCQCCIDSWNKNMNINELKIGHSVKIKDDNGSFYTGTITRIEDNHVHIICSVPSAEFRVHKDNIVSWIKIETVEKEIKIERKYNHRKGAEQRYYSNCTCSGCCEDRKQDREKRSFIDLNELKVGDFIRLNKDNLFYNSIYRIEMIGNECFSITKKPDTFRYDTFDIPKEKVISKIIFPNPEYTEISVTK